MPAGALVPLKLNVAETGLSPARIAPSAGAVMHTVTVYEPPVGPLVRHGLAAAWAAVAPKSGARTAAPTARRLSTTRNTVDLPSPEDGTHAGGEHQPDADEEWHPVADVCGRYIARVEVTRGDDTEADEIPQPVQGAPPVPHARLDLAVLAELVPADHSDGVGRRLLRRVELGAERRAASPCDDAVAADQ